MGNIRNTTESVNKKIYEKFNDNIIMLGDYIIGGRSNSYQCNQCNNVFNTRLDTLLTSKHGCKICAMSSRNKTPKQFKKEFDDKLGSKLILLEDYKNARTNILTECRICHAVWKFNPNTLNTGCRKCKGTLRKTSEQFANEIKLKHENSLSVLGQYKNNYTKINIRCNICNRHFYAKPHHLTINLTGCPDCANKRNLSENAVEKNLRTHLSFLGDFERNYTPKFLNEIAKQEKKKPQHLDFWYPQHDLAIEYNGYQHYYPVDHWGGVERLKKYKENDEKKFNLCKMNNVDILYIPYYDFDKNTPEFETIKYFSNLATEIEAILLSR